MKCKYKFPATARGTLPTGLTFAQAGRTFELVVVDSLLVGFNVTVDDYPDECLPTITPLQNQLAKASINIPEDPFRDEIVEEVRAIEGGLCVWGLDEINVDKVEIEWIPESEEDKEKLQLFSFSVAMRKKSDRRKLPMPPDLLVRTILVRKQLLQWEVPLNLYRRGRMDLSEGRYIESIYDLYFSLETMFANGKFKTKQVIDEFLNSQELCEAIESLKAEPDHREFCPSRYLEVYRVKFVEWDTREVVKGLVETRGFLHHHTLRRDGMWHPAKQGKYHVDAIIYANICTRVLMKRITDLLFDAPNFAQFNGTKTVVSNGKAIAWHLMTDAEFAEEYPEYT